ncbi:2,3-bisphosphoglycerate-independent phosphoglycerate mutase [Natronospira proteinivora]|uniref:2,3-bisphosphoglycerate-independent phosphoglycerate mutase n=1 Tax=Natronospira proteinivora TaxID=1807133 RepID=A0ABT1G9V9_9GAMM|nr:2,3-bisphosphoglycerate-independent phosphoglycerate mutase [Natronospira proteinivora]MCP1728106.1 2,3-bisphosphoglycerate-independent phosphoglycerate mutase [Natronospira proteinivora]
MSESKRPIMLVILDGWGEAPDAEDNAISQARTPNWDRMSQQYPKTLIHTSGPRVGLPDGQMGNSEVGHINLGAGRVVPQEFGRISGAIEDGSFFDNPAFRESVDRAVGQGRAVHITGLLSPGGVHSHESHLHAMVRLAAQRGAKDIFVHAILDGRDMPPRSAKASIEALEAVFTELGRGRIASLVGRFYAMDRDNRWDRIKAAYRLMTEGAGEHRAESGLAGLQAAYDRNENDEFVAPTWIDGEGGRVRDGDAVIFMNWRADRARELTQAFTDPAFEGFERKRLNLAGFVTLTQYQSDFDVPVAFPPSHPKNNLGEYAAKLGLRQLRIAETEKYAHVTFFFNGGQETKFEGEDRILVPSPDVRTYDLKPEMSAPEVTDKLVEAIESDQYDLIVCNYANADMVGHTGDMKAAILAIETLDESLGRLESTIQAAGGEMLITADHGNAEKMRDANTGQAHTAHTTNRVPLLYVGREAEMVNDGGLCDLAPTLLTLMGQPLPEEMTGHTLVKLKH